MHILRMSCLILFWIHWCDLHTQALMAVNCRSSLPTGERCFLLHDLNQAPTGFKTCLKFKYCTAWWIALLHHLIHCFHGFITLVICYPAFSSLKTKKRPRISSQPFWSLLVSPGLLDLIQQLLCSLDILVASTVFFLSWTLGIYILPRTSQDMAAPVFL